MLVKKVLVSALFAAGMIGAVATPMSSMAQVSIQLNFGPPADRYEVVPAPRAGYVWGPGHWQWNASSNQHYWTAGSWQTARPGYVYHRPQWVQNNGRWQYQNQRWDSDHDGIPNNRDSTPYGVARSRDSDRDGVPDYRDSTPYGTTRARDSDHDGVPDYRDSTPYGGRRPGDRDGDGIPDNRDSHPDNPNRG
jgi:hypothetical protein